MKKKQGKRHTPEQIIRKLREADGMIAVGQTIGQVVQSLEISEQTFHRWRNQYGGMKAQEAKRLKELEQENRRLKKLVADLALDKDTRGVPQHIRSDNGPEFIAEAIRTYTKRTDVETLYIEPGSPWENGYAESFFSRLRDELLNREEFSNLTEARWYARRHKREHNEERPHSSLG